MNYSVAMTEEVGEALRRHLVRLDGQEDLCFGVWQPSRGRTRLTALVSTAVLPEPGDREVHSNASFRPQYVERAIDAALKANGGIAFLHSHPAHGWQSMSEDDMRAEERLAPTVRGATGLPLVGLTLAAMDGTWSARVWEKVGQRKYRRVWAQSVREVGQHLSVHFADDIMKPPAHRYSQSRTVAAWGPQVQARIARLKIGVIGLGSVGSIVAEMLARTGVQRIQLIDYQRLEEVNLDRTLHATMADARSARPKVTVSAKALKRSTTSKGFRVEADQFSICEEEGYRRALDCDVLFSCVDRPWGRSVLNFIAYAHLIPVIDGGILVRRTKKQELRGADWKAHIVGPTHRCLLCLGQYDPGLIEADRNGDLEDPKYLDSLPEDHPARANENVFGFSLGLASLEALQFIMLAVSPLGLGSGGPQNYHLTTGAIDPFDPILMSCDAECVFRDLVAVGETHTAGTGRHVAAEKSRNKLTVLEYLQSIATGLARKKF